MLGDSGRVWRFWLTARCVVGALKSRGRARRRSARECEWAVAVACAARMPLRPPQDTSPGRRRLRKGMEGGESTGTTTPGDERSPTTPTPSESKSDFAAPQLPQEDGARPVCSGDVWYGIGVGSRFPVIRIRPGSMPHRSRIQNPTRIDPKSTPDRP